MTTDLARRTDMPLSLAETMTLGDTLAKSGFFQDSRGAAQAVTKILAGRELGIAPIAAMTGIYVINGRITVSANILAALVKRSRRYNYRVREMTDQVCRVEFFEDGQSIGESTFTRDDAKRAGTKNMDKFPRNMLFARALSNGVRWYCPDVTDGPIYTPEELGASVNEEGDVIDVPAIVPPADTKRAQLLARITELNAQLPEIDRMHGHDEWEENDLISRGKALRNKVDTRADLLEHIQRIRERVQEYNLDIDVPPIGNTNALGVDALTNLYNELTIEMMEEETANNPE